MNISHKYQASLRNNHVGVSGPKEPLLISESEVIFQMLQTKLQLPDGTDTFIFSYGPENEDGNRPFTCHLCWVTNMCGIENIREHLTGDRHGQNMKRLPIATHFKLPITVPYKWSSDNNNYFKIYAGENILQPDEQLKHCFSNQPLWFLRGVDEDQVKILSDDSFNEKNKNNTIMGLPYLGKMEGTDATPRYYCFLCEDYVKPEMNDGHMESLKHEMNYVEQHFPYSHTQAKQLLEFLGATERDEALCGIFRKIYREIEIKHGYKTISVVSGADFSASFIRLSSQIWSQNHYGESFSEFSELRVAAYIGQLIKNPKSYKTIKPLPNSAVDISVLNRKRRASQNADTMSPANKRHQLKNVDTSQTNTLLNVYKEQELARIKSEYEMYERNPKAYGNYSTEWNEFWHSRKAELRREGINPNAYNFHNDWKVYWKQRCDCLLSKAIQAKLSEFDKGLVPSETPNGPTIESKAMLVAGYQSPGRITIDRSGVDTSIAQNTPPPPCWMDEQQNETCKLETAKKIDTNAILKLLLALENLMDSLGPTAVQLLNQARLCQQSNKGSANSAKLKELKASFAMICKNLENHLASRLTETANVRSLKAAVGELSNIVNKLAPDTTELVDNDNFLQKQYDDARVSNSATREDETRPVFDFEVKTYGQRNQNLFDSGGWNGHQGTNNANNNYLFSRQNFSPSMGNNLNSNNVQRGYNIGGHQFFAGSSGNFRNQRLVDISKSNFSPWSSGVHTDAYSNSSHPRSSFTTSQSRGNFSSFR